jgi:cation diffusion facilitator family transporter
VDIRNDAADQIDDALEANYAGRRALLISLIGLGLTAALQAVVVLLSGSVALLGDTLHNIADALTAIPLLVAFRLGWRPANKRYTYGYGRAEDLAGLFVIAMIALSGVVAAYEAIDRLLHPRDVAYLWAVAGAGLIGFSATSWWPATASKWDGKSAQPLWWPMAYTRAPTVSPVLPCYLVPVELPLGGDGPIHW